MAKTAKINIYLNIWGISSMFEKDFFIKLFFYVVLLGFREFDGLTDDLKIVLKMLTS